MAEDESYRLGLLDIVGDEFGPRESLAPVLLLADELKLLHAYLLGRIMGGKLLSGVEIQC